MPKFAKGYRPKPAEPLNLTDREIDVIANILHQLGMIPDWRRRIDVAAMAIKIGLMNEDCSMSAKVREVCGITSKGEMS